MALWWEFRAGAGPGCAVLIPDASRTAAMWPEELSARLVERGLSVVLLDLPDQGRSPWWEAGYGFDQVVEEVAGVLVAAAAAHPSVEGFTLVGHGFGAVVALGLAVRGGSGAGGGPVGVAAGLDVGHVVAIGGSGWYADPALPGPDEAVAVALTWRRRFGGDSPDLVRALIREHRAARAAGDPPLAPAEAKALVNRWIEWGFNPCDDHRRVWLGAPALRDSLANLNLALTVVHGTADPLVPLAHGEALAACVRGARCVIVPAAGHDLTPPMIDACVDAITITSGATGHERNRPPRTHASASSAPA